MVAFDACVLLMVFFEEAGIPNDFRTGKPIDRAREKVNALINRLHDDGECILIPAPALAEVLVNVAEVAEHYITEIEKHAAFKIHPFGKREAIEIALRVKRAREAGDKKEGVEEPWQKVKYDRQIIASAMAEQARVIYSTDRDLHSHAALWGLRAIHIADLPLPDPTQAILSEDFLEEILDSLGKEIPDPATTPAAMPVPSDQIVSEHSEANNEPLSIVPPGTVEIVEDLKKQRTNTNDIQNKQADEASQESNLAKPE